MNFWRAGLAVLLLLAFAGRSGADEWHRYGQTQDARRYVDLGSVRRKGTLAKITRLVDFKEATTTNQGKTCRSAESVLECDCEGNRARSLTEECYSEAMGFGELVGIAPTAEAWSTIVPKSSEEYECAKACDAQRRK